MKNLLLIIILLAHIQNLNAYTISGISSGGFMASQMATIYSASIEGVATVAGGFYYCARNYLPQKILEDKETIGEQNLFLYEPSSKVLSDTLNPFIIFSGELNPVSWFKPSKANPVYQAVSVCMLNPNEAKIDYDYLQKNAENNLIDPLQNIAHQKVLLFHGKKDSVLDSKMQNQLTNFYQKYNVPKENLKIIKGKGGHNFPTNNKTGIDCQKEEVPYLGKCNYDLAKEILVHLENITIDKNEVNRDNLYMIDQTDNKLNINEKLADFKQDIRSVAPYGYMYASSFCLDNPNQCKIHVALHGCKMSDSYNEEFQQNYQSQVQSTNDLHVKSKKDSSLNKLLGKVIIEDKKNNFGLLKFALDSGYIKYAEKNNLIIIFPQTWITEANFPYNPKGCWDWFGWTTDKYATNGGHETKWLDNWIKNVSQNPKEYVISDRPHYKELESVFKEN